MRRGHRFDGIRLHAKLGTGPLTIIRIRHRPKPDFVVGMEYQSEAEAQAMGAAAARYAWKVGRITDIQDTGRFTLFFID